MRKATRRESQPLRIENQPLIELFDSGEVSPAESAALFALPSVLLDPAITGPLVVGMGGPVWTHLTETEVGRIALIALPIPDGELYRDRDHTARLVVAGAELAARIGARTVSLVGLLGSATDYGRTVAGALAARKGLPQVTTGHCTTAASVVMSMERLVLEAERPIGRERIGFLGLGSVGEATLELMLGRLPHPAELVLCDVRKEPLEILARDLPSRLGFRGSIRVLQSKGAVPPELYDATLIVGATNVSGLLEIDKLRPGTLIVDDSFPHCFEPARAWDRMHAQSDILLTEGGALLSARPLRETRYVPREFELVPAAAALQESLSQPSQDRIGSCILSGLLTSQFKELKPTVGRAEAADSALHYDRLRELGFSAPELWCDRTTLPQSLVTRFRRKKAIRL